MNPLDGIAAGTATYLIGDTFDRMAELPDGSVDLVLTSPPFLALRSYLPADHPDKAKEIGSEPTPADFLDTLLALTAEWWRVLAPHGSIAVELGDTYAGSGAGGGDWIEGSGQLTRTRGADVPDFDAMPKRKGNGWPLDKSLCIIPELYAAALAYGRNPLTGTESPAGQWRVRNLVRWVRPNPPVGALGDKYRPATSVMVIATRARDRWFDLDAVRTAPKSGDAGSELAPSRSTIGYSGLHKPGAPGASDQPHLVSHPAGAPPLDWWEIPTHPYKGSHYATWPPALCERPILSMCPRHVCTACGEPRRRIVGEAEYVDDAGRPAIMDMDRSKHAKPDELVRHFETKGSNTAHRSAPTLGWTDCGCTADHRPGIVLDPFAGSGTTLAVATGNSRAAIGIDLDARNAELALDRVGPMLLTIHDAPAKGAA